jgi:glutaredoxin
VLENPENLERMLKLSDGRRRVPVIVNGDHVAVGFNGRS